MARTSTLLFIFSCLLSSSGFSQNILNGRVLDKNSDRVVIAATIMNVTRNRISQSDQGGNYRIFAGIGDKVVFSSAGYKSDTFSVTEGSLFSPFDIFLERNTISLEEVKVGELSSYQLDSISRREEFEDFLNKRNTKLVGGKGNAPTDGFGVAFSPISFFSKKETDERRFRKNFPKMEEEAYIDYRFSREYVQNITKLSGDSLQQFMILYRPSYKLCRASGKADMLLYVNDKYKEFISPNKKKKKK
ncbi:MAG: hypothetical protein C5B52_01920 [Bacteroidetes bacterium]|nr:MAG: hypothetical protein C5B52_01920 [Bacteroidota bacterium]